MTRLEQILDATRARVATARTETSSADVIAQARAVRDPSAPHRLREALSSTETLNVIAEFKRASPSKGVINDGLRPNEVARAYERGGACAISVLTEPEFFRGSLDDLRAVRDAVSLPILRKDFIVDDYQIFEAAAAGADAVLLIVAALSVDELKSLSAIANELGLDALVEVHTPDEMNTAKEIGATLIGVNNRNLKTFDVSLDVSRELIGEAPPDVLMITESGLKDRGDLIELRSLGYSGFLIGETLMRSEETEGVLRELIGDERSWTPS